ncbi:hypothetical protein SAMD00019534_106160 [Acytostelium subglobosum LB1]|uniref:hypothetical protein n=1 Tax=Acytostelium subglobosum LB1 TaxID=1410327 RepID=UPI000644A8CA|nr:hypothetical protein SAMD00019534_106160 [Acytostelium subglobosum LB1]GAM27440.1 hypothetical protein SAMD00019534_106160 [Acytostelium subglobosum LB1]|eukprot:XP_012749505.1 hypothetical protein SAMD00019534_106160 [Acytostelium subglobosum LB1]
MNDVDVYMSMLNSAGSASCKTTETYRTLCSFFFMECQLFASNVSSQQLAIPVRTCRENCHRSIGQCGVSDYYDCDQTHSDNGKQVPTYPPVANPQTFNMSAFGYSGEANPLTIQCYNSTSGNITIVENTFCQVPLVYRNSSIYNRQRDNDYLGYTFVSYSSDCAIPCPAPVFTGRQWTAFYTIIDTLSMASAIASLFMIVSYGLLNRKRTNYELMLIFQNIAIFLRSLAGVIITFNGGSKATMCPDPGRSATSYDPICVASGILFYGFSFNAILWWTFMVFDLWCILRKKKQANLKWVWVAFTLFTFATTTVVTIKAGYIADKGNVICWVADNDYGYGLFWAPMGLCLLLGTIWLIWIIVDLHKMVKKAHVDTEILNKFIKSQLGPLAYIIILYATYLYIFIYNQSYHLSYQSLKAEGVVQFFQCVVRASNQHTDPSDCLVDGPKIVSYTIFVLTLHIFGLYTLFYAFNAKFTKIWKDTFSRIKMFFLTLCGGSGAGNKLFVPSTGTSTSTNTNTASTGTSSGSGSSEPIYPSMISRTHLLGPGQQDIQQQQRSFDNVNVSINNFDSTTTPPVYYDNNNNNNNINNNINNDSISITEESSDDDDNGEIPMSTFNNNNNNNDNNNNIDNNITPIVSHNDDSNITTEQQQQQQQQHNDIDPTLGAPPPPPTSTTSPSTTSDVPTTTATTTPTNLMD